MFDLSRLSQSQKDKIAEFKSVNKDLHCGAIGGRFTYEFTPTSLGLVIKIRDNALKRILDITEYEDW